MFLFAGTIFVVVCLLQNFVRVVGIVMFMPGFGIPCCDAHVDCSGICVHTSPSFLFWNSVVILLFLFVQVY